MAVKALFVNAKEIRDFAPGDTVFAEGDPGAEMFGIVSGEVELRRGQTVVARVGADGTFGELAIIDRAPRRLTAVAVAPTRLAVIDRATFLFLVHETPMFAIQVMQSVSSWLREGTGS